MQLLFCVGSNLVQQILAAEKADLVNQGAQLQWSFAENCGGALDVQLSQEINLLKGLLTHPI